MNRKNKDIERRARRVKQGRRGQGPVVYWMSRDQRLLDNYALLLAQQEAINRQKGLVIVFCLAGNFLGANSRHYLFLLKGMQELAKKCERLNICFKILPGSAPERLPAFLRLIDAHLLVTDFNPLKTKRIWTDEVALSATTPIFEVDTHNIIPTWHASDKKEYGAYTLRPKINRLLDDYLTDIPKLVRHPYANSCPSQCISDPLNIPKLSPLIANGSIPEIDWCQPGEKAAQLVAKDFLTNRLVNYDRDRNNPCFNGQSEMSPYLHFGHISPQRLVLMTSQSPAPSEAKQSFLEELIVRRELADNFCYYETQYDSFTGFHPWAQKTLNEHRKDKRDFTYSLHQLINCTTHERLWNSCQKDLMIHGKLHGYLRMYWAKKILGWTESPEQALEFTIYLNDTYSLDGCDPNGYTGISWSIGGVHDRAWKERQVFGKVRYMNEKGCRRKFDVEKYISKIENS